MATASPPDVTGRLRPAVDETPKILGSALGENSWSKAEPGLSPKQVNKLAAGQSLRREANSGGEAESSYA